ncbi:DUF5711 family protein [Anaeropeptidivorans aminofermentans]|uniref:DUF5711 family protein n=1 Tax=Anaeropeptidivorans aminofermentans TaxID=2934315 RepID=UPI002024F9EB|nr:DUF5711 family protein [Anaeropeptidivorans aminofermentans]
MNGSKKGHEMRVKSMMVALGLIVLAVFLYFKWGMNDLGAGKNLSYMGFIPLGEGFQYDYGKTPDIYYSNKGIFLSTQDGVKRLDTEGALKWDYPLSFNSPRMQGEGGYVIISESKGLDAYVFSEEGFLYKIGLENPLLSCGINKKGHAFVITSTDTGSYTVNTYNEKGALVSQDLKEDEGIYPISADISDDGRILAVSALSTRGINISSVISFYYINSAEAASFTDGLFATASDFDNEIVSKINFTDGNKLMYLSDQSIGAIETGTDNYLKELWRAELKNEIERSSFVNGSIYAISMGKVLNNKDGYKEGTLLYYDILSGEIKLQLETGSSINYMSGGNGSLIISGGASGKDFTALNAKGDKLWEYRGTADSMKIIILDKTDKIACTTPLKFEIMQRGRVSSSNPSDNKEEALTEEEMNFLPIEGIDENSPSETPETPSEAPAETESAEPSGENAAVPENSPEAP